MTGKKNKSGGFREGSGRKQKYGEETKVIRVPISLVSKIDKMLRDYSRKKDEQIIKTASKEFKEYMELVKRGLI